MPNRLQWCTKNRLNNSSLIVLHINSLQCSLYMYVLCEMAIVSIIIIALHRLL